MQDPIKILGVPVHAMTMQEAVKTLEERMLAKEQTFVVTANAEIIMMCQENAEYKKIICEDAELEDSGPGMSDEIREHIFQPGFSSKGESGHGFGL